MLDLLCIGDILDTGNGTGQLHRPGSEALQRLFRLFLSVRVAIVAGSRAVMVIHRICIFVRGA